MHSHPNSLEQVLQTNYMEFLAKLFGVVPASEQCKKTYQVS